MTFLEPLTCFARNLTRLEIIHTPIIQLQALNKTNLTQLEIILLNGTKIGHSDHIALARMNASVNGSHLMTGNLIPGELVKMRFGDFISALKVRDRDYYWFDSKAGSPIPLPVKFHSALKEKYILR